MVGDGAIDVPIQIRSYFMRALKERPYETAVILGQTRRGELCSPVRYITIQFLEFLSIVSTGFSQLTKKADAKSISLFV